MVTRLPHHLTPTDDAQPVHGLGAQENVLRHRELGDDRQLLMNHADTDRLRIAGRTEQGFAAIEPHHAVEHGVDAGDDFHQRALAGPVLPDQPVDLARTKVEIDAFKGRHAAEPFADAFELQQVRRTHDAS